MRRAGSGIIGQNMRLEAVLKNCRLDAAHTETFAFTRPTTLLADLVEKFARVDSSDTRLGAVFAPPPAVPQILFIG
jgi:hypothetical protein